MRNVFEWLIELVAPNDRKGNERGETSRRQKPPTRHLPKNKGRPNRVQLQHKHGAEAAKRGVHQLTSSDVTASTMPCSVMKLSGWLMEA